MTEVFKQVLFWKECKEYGVKLWNCPNFLFLVMGIVTSGAMIITYNISSTLVAVEFVIMVVSSVTLIIFVPGVIIVQSFERIAEANRMKSEFVSIASHQLRSPLSAINWGLEFVLGGKLGKLDKEKEEYLSMLYGNSGEMLKIVNNLLNVSRLEQGRFAFQPKNINIAEMAKSIVGGMSPLAYSNNVKLTLDIKNSPMPDVLGDDIYTRMVITNLVDNAIKYSKKNILDAYVAVRLFTDSDSIKLEVEDNGMGVSKKDQDLIFDKFYRSKAATKQEVVGTGLGLFIAKAVIKNFGGDLNFKSKEGEGSTFWFTLPIQTQTYTDIKQPKQIQV